MVFLMVSSHDRCSKVSNWQVIIVPGSGLSPNGRQTIIWTATFTDAYLRCRWVKPSHFTIHSTVWGKFFMLTTKKSVHYCSLCWLNSPNISPVMGQLCPCHDGRYVRLNVCRRIKTILCISMIFYAYIGCMLSADPILISWLWEYYDGLVQDRSNSSALAMELLQSCTRPSICTSPYYLHQIVITNHRLLSGLGREAMASAVCFTICFPKVVSMGSLHILNPRCFSVLFITSPFLSIPWRVFGIHAKQDCVTSQYRACLILWNIMIIMAAWHRDKYKPTQQLWL